MADMLDVQFILGPCDAQHKSIAADLLRGGSVACGGGVYYVRVGTANPVFLDYAPRVEQAAEANAKYDPRALFVSWHALMRTLAFGVPAELRRIRRDANRLKRAVR